MSYPPDAFSDGVADGGQPVKVLTPVVAVESSEEEEDDEEGDEEDGWRGGGVFFGEETGSS